MSLASIPALAVATLIPVGYLYWVSQRDFFETRKVQLIRICFVWGLMAYLLAYLIQSNLYSSGILTRDQLVRFVVVGDVLAVLAGEQTEPHREPRRNPVDRDGFGYAPGGFGGGETHPAEQ